MVSRIPAREQAAKRGSIFINIGGPGGRATDQWAARVNRLPTDITDYFDLIAVQPRGLRGSTPLQCQNPAEDIPGADELTLQLACINGSGRDYVSSITTENTARDIDEVRKALGEDKISFLGYSYGTYLGGMYGTLFSDHTDKLVLDSVMNPEWHSYETHYQQKIGREQRLIDLFDWIAQNDDTYHVGKTRADVYSEWARQVTSQGNDNYANISPGLINGHGLAGTPLDGMESVLTGSAQSIGRTSEPISEENIARFGNQLRSLAAVLQPEKTGSKLYYASDSATYKRNRWPTIGAALSLLKYSPSSQDQIARTLDYGSSSQSSFEDPAEDWVFTAVTCNDNHVAPDHGAAFKALAGGIRGDGYYPTSANRYRGGLLCAGWLDNMESPNIGFNGHGIGVRPLVIQSFHDPATSTKGAAVS